MTQKSHIIYLLVSLATLSVLVIGIFYIMMPINLSKYTRNKISIAPSPNAGLLTPTTSTNQSDLTDDWITYENRAGRYSIKVPNHWRILDLKEAPDEEVVSSVSLYPDPLSTTTYQVWITVYNNPYNYTIEQFINKNGEKTLEDTTPTQRRLVRIGHYDAEWYPNLVNSLFKHDSYFIKKDAKLYELALLTPSQEKPHFDIFNKIISTFFLL